MDKNFISISKLTVIMALSFFCNTLFAQNDFAFELNKPATNKMSVKSNGEISVEITFNAEAVNEAGAYIATVSDGKMVGFSASTTMESPFSTTIPAKHLGVGKHIIEYMLLPSGSQDQSKALAKVAMEVVVEECLLKAGVDIEIFTQNIVKTIRKNDVTSFNSYCISKKAMDFIIQSIEGDSPEVTGIKAELSSMDAEMAAKELRAAFNNLQEAFAEKGADISFVRLQTILEQDIKLEMPTFSAMDMRYVIGSGDTTFIISVDLFLTEENAYLFNLKFKPGL